MSSLQMRTASTKDIKQVAAFIAHKLVPEICAHGLDHVGDTILDQLRLFFDHLLHHTNIDAITLMNTRIHHVLAENFPASSDSKWPPDITQKAQDLLHHWNVQGLLADIISDSELSGQKIFERRMTVQHLTGQRTRSLSPPSVLTEGPHARFDGPHVPSPLRSGHNGFKIGAWFVDMAAAIQMGIIGDPHITYEDDEVYAVVLHPGEEEDPENQKGLCPKYLPPRDHPAARRLMGLIISHKSVRVLRAGGLIGEPEQSMSMSPVAPSCGIRYEGLYVLHKWGIQACTQSTGRKSTQYYYLFQRIEEQPPFALACARPTTHEIHQYHIRKEQHEVEGEKANVGRGRQGSSSATFQVPSSASASVRMGSVGTPEGSMMTDSAFRTATTSNQTSPVDTTETSPVSPESEIGVLGQAKEEDS